MKSCVLFALGAFLALVPAQVAAGGDDWHNTNDHPDNFSCPKSRSPGQWAEKPQVLWGQCGGYYYCGTKKCPEGAYCRKFSDWYSQCNLIGN